MSLLREIQTLTSIRLSETQKEVMCKIIAAPTDELAYEAITTGTNRVAARDQLTDLGLIDWREGFAEVTDNGMQVLQDEALTDEGGQLTEEGNKFAYGEGGGGEDQVPDGEAAAGVDPEAGVGSDMQRDADPMTAGPDMSGAAEAEMDFAGFKLVKAVNAKLLND